MALPHRPPPLPEDPARAGSSDSCSRSRRKRPPSRVSTSTRRDQSMPAPDHLARSVASAWPSIGRRVVLVAMVAALVLLVRPVPSPRRRLQLRDGPRPDRCGRRRPRTAIFTGTMLAATPEGTPVQLTRWFRGPMPQPVIWLDNAGFEDPTGGMCGANRPSPVAQRVDLRQRLERGRAVPDQPVLDVRAHSPTTRARSSWRAPNGSSGHRPSRRRALNRHPGPGRSRRRVHDRRPRARAHRRGRARRPPRRRGPDPSRRAARKPPGDDR